MIHTLTLIVTIEEGLVTSSWRISRALTVVTTMLTWVSLVYLLSALTIFLLNNLPMKIILVYSLVPWMNILLITISIQGQPDWHQRELGEVHRLSLTVNVRQHISSKYAKIEDYRMSDVLPTISKAGAESSKRRQHGCAFFAIWKTQKISTGNAIPSLAENVFRNM